MTRLPTDPESERNLPIDDPKDEPEALVEEQAEHEPGIVSSVGSGALGSADIQPESDRELDEAIPE